MDPHHMNHPSGLPLGRAERGWGVYVKIGAAAYLDLQGLASEEAAQATALAALRAWCEAQGLSSDGDGGALLARLRDG